MTHAQFMPVYSKLTGLDLPYDPLAHDSDLFRFFKRFDEQDFALVVKHIKKRYADKPEYIPQMLRFRYLIRQLDTFAELLAEAKACNPRGLTERDKVLMASGRAAESAPEQPARSTQEVLRKLSREECAQGFRDMLEALDKPEPTNPEHELEQLLPSYEPAEPTNPEEPF